MSDLLHVYRVRRWDEHFETSESRKRVGPLEWVSIPTKHDGRGYKRVARSKNGPLKLLAWWSLLQVAAKMPVRGFLADYDGPLTALDLSDKTEIPEKFYEYAFDSLILPEIGWLEKLVWDENKDFAGNCCALLGIQQIPARTSRRQQKAGDKQRAEKEESVPLSVPEPQQTPAESAGVPADTSTRQQKPAESSPTSKTSKTSQTSRPPTVPQGGQARDNSSDSSDREISDPEEFKRLVCELILKGKNPSRPWSYEAMDGLARNLPVPMREIRAVAWFHKIPPDDAVQELRSRRQSEGTLMPNWSDEVTKAAGYREKLRATGPGTPAPQKKEPDLWREYFRWKYGPEIALPDRFTLLGSDQLREWNDGREEFERFWATREPAAAGGAA